MSFREHFNPAGLKVPDAPAPTRSRLLASWGFRPPRELLLDGYCTPAEDQGSKPWCAAYAATSFGESVMWRKTGRPDQIDPGPVYAHAKSIDGDPDGDGTYLECALEGLKTVTRALDGCDVRSFGNSRFGLGLGDGLLEVKFAVHRYGCCLAGFDITDEWFSPKDAVIRGTAGEKAGGHAVLVCGYDENGVLIMNSWGRAYGRDGKVYVSNSAFERQFMYGATLTRAFDGLE